MPLYAPLLISKGKYSSYILFGSATLFVCLFDVKVKDIFCLVVLSSSVVCYISR